MTGGTSRDPPTLDPCEAAQDALNPALGKHIRSEPGKLWWAEALLLRATVAECLAEKLAGGVTF